MSVKKKSVSQNEKTTLQKQKSELRHSKSALQNASIADFCDNNCASGIKNNHSGPGNLEAEIRDQKAELEKQIAFLEEQIARLQASDFRLQEGDRLQASDFRLQEGDRLQASDFRLQEKAQNTHPEVRSPKSEVRIGPPLATPVIDSLTPIGSSFMRVLWSPVTNAGGYVVRYSTDETFATNLNTVSASPSDATVMLSGLEANTTYYVSVKTLGNGTSIDSPFSAAQSATTGIASDNSVTDDLQNWLDDLQIMFQNVAMLVPQLETTDLNTSDRRRLLGSGVRRYGFIEKTADIAEDFPQIWPGLVEDTGKLKEMVGEIEVLRNLLIWFRCASRIVQDLLLIAGNDAFRLAGAYYTAAREGARQKNPEAVQVYDMLKSFWKRPRRIMDEPTEMEMLRDAKALLRGRKDGQVSISNESDSVIKGKKVLVDNTFPKPRGGVKVVESAEVE